MSFVIVGSFFVERRCVKQGETPTIANLVCGNPLHDA